jgi:hypothetical protein
MSSTLQNKMYNYEVNPPEKVWHSIAAALDEWEADKKIAALVNSTEATPPPAIWEALTQELEEMNTDKQFRDELYNLEVTPPDIWSRLNTQLTEEEPEQKLAGKLLAMEVWPPEESWKKIKQTLEEKPAAKVIRFGNWKKWAAAAVLTGAIVTTTVILVQRNNTAGGELVTVKPEVKPVPADQQPIQVQPPAPQPVVSNNELIAGKEKNTVPVKNNGRQSVPGLQEEVPVIASFLPGNESKDHNNDNKPSSPKSRIHKALGNANTENATAALDSRYYLLLNADGELVRVSKKLDEMQCVLKGGLDIPFDENDEKNKQCNEQVKEWQNQLNNPSVISALDISAIIAGK